MMNQPQKSTVVIFSDASTAPKSHISIGSFLILNQEQLKSYAQSTAADLTSALAHRITYKQYVSIKSTWSEIKTIIEALYTVLKESGPTLNVEIYTDCQSFCDLMTRRKENLEKNNFMTRSGKSLHHVQLYKELFALTTKFHIKIFKIKGHVSFKQRETLHEKIFTMLDQLTRKQLRSVTNKF